LSSKRTEPIFTLSPALILSRGLIKGIFSGNMPTKVGFSNASVSREGVPEMFSLKFLFARIEVIR